MLSLGNWLVLVSVGWSSWDGSAASMPVLGHVVTSGRPGDRVYGRLVFLLIQPSP